MLNFNKIVDENDVILVDLDNTLFNYTKANKLAVESVLRKFNIPQELFAQARKNIKTRNLGVNGHKKEFYFKNICELQRRPLIDSLEMYDCYSETFKENLDADTSMLNMMKYAKEQGVKIIAITNYYVVPQLRKLKRTGFIQYIDQLVTSEEFEVEKPNKRLLTRALELADNPDLSRVIMIGDSVVDNLTSLGVKYYPYNCSKLLISVSGKSGAGKSTISKCIRDSWNALIIEGDGYHKYDRSHKAWENITHYNPKANNLIKMRLDIETIYHDIGKIEVPIYNHSNGKLSNGSTLDNQDVDVLVIEGLHTLYPEVTGDYVKIRMFIDSSLSDDQKIKRDTTERQKTIETVENSIIEREVDYNKYISIQKKYANFLIEVNDENFKITLSDELGDKVVTGEYKDLITTIGVIMSNLNKQRFTK